MGCNAKSSLRMNCKTRNHPRSNSVWDFLCPCKFLFLCALKTKVIIIAQTRNPNRQTYSSISAKIHVSAKSVRTATSWFAGAAATAEAGVAARDTAPSGTRRAVRSSKRLSTKTKLVKVALKIEQMIRYFLQLPAVVCGAV